MAQSRRADPLCAAVQGRPPWGRGGRRAMLVAWPEIELRENNKTMRRFIRALVAPSIESQHF